jgi:hypothetical protein
VTSYVFAYWHSCQVGEDGDGGVKWGNMSDVLKSLIPDMVTISETNLSLAAN